MECLLSFGAESVVFMVIFACFVWVCDLVAHKEGGTSYVEDFLEQGAEVGIMVQEERGNEGVEKTTQ